MFYSGNFCCGGLGAWLGKFTDIAFMYVTHIMLRSFHVYSGKEDAFVFPVFLYRGSLEYLHVSLGHLSVYYEYVFVLACTVRDLANDGRRH